MEKKNVLVTGTRAPGALEICRFLSELGHRVITTDSVFFELSRCSQASARFYKIPSPRFMPNQFETSLREIIAKEDISILIPTCEEIFHISKVKHLLPSQCQIFCESIEVLERLHHKGEFIKWAMELGLPVPETITIPFNRLPLSGGELRKALPASTEFVVKPSYTRFSSEVLISKLGVIDEDRLLKIGTHRDLIVQDFKSGQQVCTYSLVRNGQIVAHSSYRSVHTAGLGATIHFEEALQVQARSWVERFVYQISFSGQIAFDFIELEDRTVVPIECNPRLTSGVHLLSAKDIERWLSPDNSILSGKEIEVEPKRSMLGLAMLIYGILNVLKRRVPLRQYLKDIFTTRDCLFRLSDPLPYVFQFMAFLQFFWVGVRGRTSALEASTQDICWNESNER